MSKTKSQSGKNTKKETADNADNKVVKLDRDARIIQRQFEEGELQRKEIVKAAEEFVQTTHSVHRVVERILQARSLSGFFETTKRACEEELGVDDALFAIGTEKSTGQVIAPGAFSQSIRIVQRYSVAADGENVITRPIRKSLSPVGKELIGVGSEAVLKLRLDPDMVSDALLVLTSEDPEFFGDDRATDLLKFLSNVVSAQLALWLRL